MSEGNNIWNFFMWLVFGVFIVAGYVALAVLSGLIGCSGDLMNYNEKTGGTYE